MLLMVPSGPSMAGIDGLPGPLDPTCSLSKASALNLIEYIPANRHGVLVNLS